MSDDLLKRNLWKVFHLKHFANNKQEEAVKAILKRQQDVVVSMPSGSRKSVCFQLPGIMQANKITIVFSPSTSSIKDQMHYLKKSKISAKSITTSISADEREQLTNDLINDKTEIRFLYVTPELATATDTFVNILQSLHTNDKLAYFAVDEGHCVSQQVQDFRQDHIKLALLRTAYARIPWIVLTHIASADVLNDIIENLQLNKPVATFKKSSFRKNLYHDIIFKNTILDVFTHLKKYVISCLETDDDDVNAENKNKKPCGIIYCKNRETVDLVVDKLSTQGIFTKAYHGGMRTSDRKKVLDEWMKGVFPVITSTTTAGSSLGKSSIRFVVHWDVPRSIATYYKETGLAGRDRKFSYCRIYYCKLDVMSIDSTLKSDIAKSKDENSRRKALRAHADFLKMSDLCETVMCRHKMFSDYFEDIAPNCKDTCDACKHPTDASLALDIFHRLSAAPTREATYLVELENPPGNVSPARTIIKEELDDIRKYVEPSSTIVNGQTIKLEHPAQQTPSPNRIRHPRSVSPAKTCIKEEEVGNVNLSDELFGMQTQPPRNVNPARTVVKEEFGDDSAVGGDNKAGLKNSFVPPRCVSPAETIIEEKPVVNLSSTSSVTCSPKSVPSGQTTSLYSRSTVIKKEPIDGSELTSLTAPGNQIRTSFPTALTDPITPTTRSHPVSNSADSIPGVSSVTGVEQVTQSKCSADRSPRTRIPTLTTVKTERLSPDKSAGNGTEVPTHPRTPSPTLTIVKDECLSPVISNRTNSEINDSFKYEFVSKLSDAASKPTTSNSPDYHSVSPYATDSKLVASTKQSPDRSRRTLSSTVTDDKCLSFDRSTGNAELETDYRRYKFNRPFQHETAKPSHTVSKPTSSNSPDCHLDAKRNIKCELEQTVPGKTVSPSEKIRRSLSNHSCDDCKNPSEGHNITEAYQKTQTRRRSRSRSPPKRRSRSRSQSKKRSVNKNSYRRRSRSRSLTKRRSRSRSSSRRRSRSRSLSRRRSRSRSNERYKRHSNSLGRSSPSSSSYRKKSHRKDSHKSSKRQTKRERLSDVFDSDRESKRRRERESETRDRMKRYSSESDAEDNKNSSNNLCYSTQPSTSTNGMSSYYSKLSRMRFSVSPDNEIQENSEPDYGWEDAAPPKPEPQSKSTLTEIDPSIKEKIEIFSSKLKSEYDLDVIGSYSKDLFQAIQESIALEAQRKLTELDQKIQKEKDDYARQLFGTDNFDSWDDDPALSNVENTHKLQQYKSLVPDDVPLLDKMSMKHVINVMKLTPARDRNELVFHGNIKKIENEFQGQELPSHLMESIKMEKSIIAELVKKNLMPYYNGGRIQPKEIFVGVARTISHIFYDRFADESIIRKYIDDLFRKVGKVTKATNLHI